MGYIPTRLITSNCMTTFRREIKKIIKCILVSSPCDLTVDQINEDFIDLEGRAIPFFAISCKCNLKDYFLTLDDILWVDPTTGITELIEMPTVNKSAHIRKWVLKDVTEDEGRPRFVHPNSPAKRLPHWRIVDIINLLPSIEFEDQMDVVVMLNRNKGVMTLQQFETDILKFVQANSVRGQFDCVERLLENLSHIVQVYGNLIRMDLSIYSIDVKDLGLNPYYVPRVPIIPVPIIENILKLIADQSHGIWAHFLPQEYKDTYGYPLDYWTFGFPTVTQFLGTLPHIFRLRRFKGYFRLYDMRNRDPPAPGVPKQDVKRVLSMLAKYIEGVHIDYFEATYLIMYQMPFSIEPMGFDCALDAVKTLTDDGIILQHDGDEIMVNLKYRTMARIIKRVEPFQHIKLVDAMPMELYPSSVALPGDIVPRNICVETDIRAEGGFEVKLHSVYSPAGFFCSVKNGYWQELERELNKFYKECGARLRMPSNAAVPGLFAVICNQRSYERVLIVAEAFCPEHVDILSIDTGFQKSVPNHSLYYMHKKFQYVPNQAFLCYLANMVPANYAKGYSRRSIDKFMEMVHGKTLVAKLYKVNMRNMEAGVFLIDKTDGADIDVRCVMLQGYYGLVTFAKPLWSPLRYATWSLYTRLVF